VFLFWQKDAKSNCCRRWREAALCDVFVALSEQPPVSVLQDVTLDVWLCAVGSIFSVLYCELLSVWFLVRNSTRKYREVFFLSLVRSNAKYLLSVLLYEEVSRSTFCLFKVRRAAKSLLFVLSYKAVLGSTVSLYCSTK
jgi:hypothetical protein